MKTAARKSGISRVLILGSTGSIGLAALDVIRADGSGRFELVGLSAGSSGRLLAQQVREFGVPAAALLEEGLEGYRSRAAAGCPEPLIGPQGILELIRGCEPDYVLVGIAGAAAIPAVFEAIRCSKRVALANKECLVAAGSLLIKAARDAACELIPVDSEHSAAFRLLASVDRSEVHRLLLTASGGPFLAWGEEQLAGVGPLQAKAHPVWTMGSKISVDSASYMNKALELVEAHWLFGLPEERLEVLVHPQSLVHALVELEDGSLLAQMNSPDMRVPIRYSLHWPERPEGRLAPIDLARSGRLDFQAPEARALRALELGRRAIRDGGSAGAVLNAANEVAVEAFLAGKLPFPGIVPLVEKVYDSVPNQPLDDLAGVLIADSAARQEARRCLPLSTR